MVSTVIVFNSKVSLYMYIASRWLSVFIQLILICTFPSHPRYTILSSGNLAVTGAVSSDSGMYQCWVENAAGQISRATWLRVLSEYHIVESHFATSD